MNYRSYKYRLYPTKEQANFLDQNFGAVRFVWNELVANFNSWAPDQKPEKLNEKILKDRIENAWLKSMISYALQQKQRDFDETKNQFFNKKRKKKLGRMKFKKKGCCNETFRIPGQPLGYSKCVDFENSTLKLTKMSPIKIVLDRTFSGEVVWLTVSKNKTNQYFVSILTKEEIPHKEKTGKSIGIDLGLTHLATLSDGTKIDNPRWFRKSQSKLAKAQQHLSRKTIGSNRYKNQKLKVASVHRDIANQRSWFIHNLTTKLVSDYDLICIEDLNAAGMKKLFGKSVSDAGFGMIRQQLEYKAKWYGKKLVKVDRFFPSSKLCSDCGWKNTELTLADREWVCQECGCIHDRDENAAINILEEGYRIMSEESPDYRRGEDVRLSDFNRKADFCEALKP